MTRHLRSVAALAASLAVLALANSPARSGAWVQSKHGYFLKLTGTYLYTTEEFDSEGNILPIRAGEPGIENATYKEVTATGYLEYGVTERLTLVANLPFKIVTSQRTELPAPGSPMRHVEVVTGGLADLTVSGRYLMFGKATPVSVQAGVKVPMGYDAAPPDQGAPLGSGKVDVEGHLLAGASLYPVPAYLTGQIGYRLRGGMGIADEYLFQVEAGLNPGFWLFKVTLDGIYSAKAPEEEESSTVTVTNQDVLKVIPTIGYTFTKRFWIGAEAYHPLHGKNTVAGTTYAVGIAFTR
jgi:hypothetical protein